MTPVAKRGLLVSGGFVLLVIAVSLAFVSFDSAAVRGMLIGTALGLVNLVVGLIVTRRSLHHSTTAGMGTVTGGFFIRLVVLVSLFLVFRNSTTVSATAFGLTFVAFFFVYLAAEIIMVERQSAGHA